MQPTSHLKNIVLAVCLGAVTISAQAQQDTLAGAVKEAMDYQPEIQAKLHAFNAATFDRREAFGGYLPTVDLNGSLGQADRQHDNRSWYSRNYAEVSLTQILFDGFRVRNQVAKAEHTSRMRYYELLDEAENKSLEVTGAYLDVLRYREMVRLAQVNLDNHRRVQGQIEQRANRGVSNNADLLQINGRSSLAESNLLTEIANLQTVNARFQRLVGRLPAEDMAEVASGQFSAPTDVQAVLDEGYANNPSLHAAFENIDVTQSALKAAKSNRYPTFEFGASHGTYKNNNSFDNRSPGVHYGDESIVEIRMKYNLYRGGSDRAAERAAFQRVNQAE
ncbi:MAG TPA: TolC family protein, partial [Pseudomonadales bacterium]|nr:TolC family protein [Pseudomonadales bacterium]